MNFGKVDPAILKTFLDMGAELLLKELTKEPTVKRDQHVITFALASAEYPATKGIIELLPPPDDGRGRWYLAGWKVVERIVYAHWGRTVAEMPAEPEFELSGEGPSEEEASTTQPEQ